MPNKRRGVIEFATPCDLETATVLVQIVDASRADAEAPVLVEAHFSCRPGGCVELPFEIAAPDIVCRTRNLRLMVEIAEKPGQLTLGDFVNMVSVAFEPESGTLLRIPVRKITSA